MEKNPARLETRRSAAIAAAIGALILAGCSKDEAVVLPVTELPSKPISTDIPCEDLTVEQDTACMDLDEGSRDVCRKVQKNERLCTNQQDFTKRLYNERDGK